MKKVISLLLATIMMFSLFAMTIEAGELVNVGEYKSGKLDDEKFTTKDGFVYFLNDDGSATVCGVPENMKKVVIPSKVDGYTVKAINSHCQKFTGATNVESVTVPDTVTYVGGFSLRSFENATEINLPSSITEIGKLTFFNNTAYYKNPDNWDNGCLYLGTNLVAMDNTAHETLVLHDDITCVAERLVIADSPEIKKVILPDHFVHNLVNLPLNKSLESAVIPAGLDVVPENMFVGCTNLSEVIIEDGVKAIGKNAFAGCTKLTSLTIPESVTDIGEKAVGYGITDYFETSNKYIYLHTEDFVVYGHEGSVAEEYAKANELTFRNFYDTPITEPTSSVTEATEPSTSENDKSTGSTESSTEAETEPAEVSTPDETKPSEPSEGKGVLGDVNGDGKVNVKDATMIQKAAAKVIKLADDESLRADVNADSKVNVKDATAIQKFAAKIETGFPIGKDISA